MQVVAPAHFNHLVVDILNCICNGKMIGPSSQFVNAQVSSISFVYFFNILAHLNCKMYIARNGNEEKFWPSCFCPSYHTEIPS